MPIPVSVGDQRRITLAGALLAALAAVLALPNRAHADVPAPTVVTLTFDDGTQNQYDNARPILSAHQMHGTFYINSGRVNTAGYMSKIQLAALASDGNEIGGHTVDHADLPTMTDDDQKREVCNDRVTLLNMGFNVKNFAYPYGDASPATQQIVASCGYNSARTVGGITTPGTCTGCPYAESIPPMNSYFTQTPDSTKNDTTLATMQGYVTQAEQHGGGWVQLVIHHVCDGCGDIYSLSPATLSAFLDWLASRASTGTTVKTVDEVIGGALQPGVSGPPLPPPTAGNLVQNASLESAASNGLPTCFQFGGYGANSYTWTRSTDGHTGSNAEQLTVTNYTSGDRKLVTRQDASSCVPAAVPGHTYKAGLWYKGSWGPSVLVKLTLYYRSSTGAWLYWTSGPALPPSGAWAQTPAYVSPPVPTGATALSIGLGISGLGTLVTDDYSLSDTSAS